MSGLEVIGMVRTDATTWQGVTQQELGQAARNHAMHLEGLRYDVTPPGMHYLVIHWDIPAADEATWTVDVDGLVDRPLTLSLADLRARPAVTRPVTMECAGNGRALMPPRAESQPWLDGAVGNAEWTGTPLPPILEEAGLQPDAVDLVFTGADHGIQGDVEQDYQWGFSLADIVRDDVLLAYEMNGQPLPPQHGFPVRLLVPDWYGMCSVKWLRRITAVAEPFDGFQPSAYQLRQDPDGPGDARDEEGRPRHDAAAGLQRFPRPGSASSTRARANSWAARGPAGDTSRGSRSAPTGERRGRTPILGPAPASPSSWRAWSFTWDAVPGGARARSFGPPTTRATSSRTTRPGTTAAS